MLSSLPVRVRLWQSSPLHDPRISRIFFWARFFILSDDNVPPCIVDVGSILLELCCLCKSKMTKRIPLTKVRGICEKLGVLGILRGEIEPEELGGSFTMHHAALHQFIQLHAVELEHPSRALWYCAVNHLHLSSDCFGTVPLLILQHSDDSTAKLITRHLLCHGAHLSLKEP